jgi:hypothetical protein
MTNSTHYFNQNKQQIYRIKGKGNFGWFVNKNAGKYLAAKLLNIFVGLRIMLLGLGILAFFI